MALRWYVVHAYSNFEHKVSASLKDRIKLHGLDDKFGEILVPTEEVVEMRRPAPITEREANAILRRVEEGAEKPRPKVLFEPGEVVRVTDGPFNDFNGVVESVNYEKSRMQVAVQILGRSTPVELEFSQVEKA